MVKSKYRNIVKKTLEPWWLFTFIAVFFGTIYTLTTPPLWGLDETSHFARVYQLARGDVFPNMNPDNYGGTIPANLYNLFDHTKNDLLDNTGGDILSRKDITNTNDYQQFLRQPFSDEERQYLWTATYSPIAYLAPTTGVFIAGFLDMTIGQTLMFARLMSLAFYIIIVFTSLKILGDLKARWLIFTIALLPISLFQAAVVTADNIGIALSILFFSLFVKLILQTKNEAKRGHLYLLALVAILLPLIKVNYIFISLAILLLPGSVFGLKNIAATFKAASISAAIIVSLIWSSVVNVTGRGPVSQRPDGKAVVPADQFSGIINNPLEFIEVCFRTIVINADIYLYSLTSLIGWNFVTIPIIFVAMLFGGLGLAGLYAKDELSFQKRKLVSLTLLLIAGTGSIFAALYVAFNPIGNRVIDGIQGRYFLPFLFPAVLIFSAIVPVEVKLKDKLVPYFFGSVSVICLTISVIYYYLATY